MQVPGGVIVEIILASASPRRTALLTQAGIAHRVIAADVDEAVSDWTDIGAAVTALALRKARSVARALAADGALNDRDRPPGRVEAVVIGADTVVAIAGRVLGKPQDAQEARAMLACLAGRAHDVFTGVAMIVLPAAQERCAHQRTQVVMRRLSPAVIAAYAATGEGQDKAGAYALQGMAGGFVTEIHGDPHSVIGLPLGLVAEWLEALGYPWLRDGGDVRASMHRGEQAKKSGGRCD